MRSQRAAAPKQTSFRRVVSAGGFFCAVMASALSAQDVGIATPGQAASSAAASLARAVRIARGPVLDGRADDEAWRGATVIDDFLQAVPSEAGPPAFPTSARVAYDDRNLYVFVRATDPHPDSLVKRLSRRDIPTSSDQIGLVIDAYHDRRSGVMLAVNPVGVRFDAAVFQDNQQDAAWDGVWEVVTAVDSTGWSAEFRIPFSQLRFNDRDEHTFGFGIWRDVARRNQRDAWPPTYREGRQGLMSQMGTLQGIAGIQRSSKLELLPFVTTQNVTEKRGNDWAHPQKATAGLDLRYGIKENLTLDATINPDFGQVEADPAILNLTAFEVRFEERRPFFQEGMSMFRCQPCQGIFYSRRIGRTPQVRRNQGDPLFTTILGAAKLTGRLGSGVTLGLIDAVTQREVGVTGRTVEPQTNYLVGRVSREMRQGRTSIGAVFTAVNRDLDADTRNVLRGEAYMGVLEGFHRFAGDSYEFGAYTGRNYTAGSPAAVALTQQSPVHLYQRPDGDERFDSTRTSMAGGVVAFSLSKLTGALRFTSNVRLASTGIELNDAGLVPLVNDRSIRNNISLRSLRPAAFYRSSFNNLELENHWTSGGLPSGASARLHTSFTMRNNWGWAVTYGLSNYSTNYCVSCARGGPALRLDPSQTLQLNLVGDSRQAFVPTLEWAVSAGDGRRSWERRGSAGAELRASPRLSVSLAMAGSKRVDNQQWIGNYGHFLSDTTHYTFARLAQTTLSMTARVSFTVTPVLTFQFYGQPFVSTGSFTDWREISAPRAGSYAGRFRSYGASAPAGFNVKQFNSNAVVRWEYRPGSTLFVVWQQGRQQDGLNPGTFEFARDYRDLFRAHPNNTLLVKATYFFTP